MKTLKSKYKQGNTRNKWKIQQCQSEKLYFGYHKNCDNCDGQTYCYSMRFRPFYVEVANRMLVFADTFDNAKEYATKGHGWLIERESVRGMLLNIKLEDDYLHFEPDFNSDCNRVKPSPLARNHKNFF